jgi:hypothetical protein
MLNRQRPAGRGRLKGGPTMSRGLCRVLTRLSEPKNITAPHSRPRLLHVWIIASNFADAFGSRVSFANNSECHATFFRRGLVISSSAESYALSRATVL